MKRLEKVLLVFDDSKESDFINANLLENEFIVFNSPNLTHALLIVKQIALDLIVVNTADTEADLQAFANQIKNEQKETIILSLIELENYLTYQNKEYVAIKPVRPKLLLSLIRSLMERQDVNWLPSLHMS